MDVVDRAVSILRSAGPFLAFTGAGISTESGIPDFRGPDGVWTKVDPAEFTIDRYLTRRDTRVRSWRVRRDSGALEARPNRGHQALARLWEADRLVGVVTQNIDGLHQAAGVPADAVVELHGNAHRSVCVDCGHDRPTAEVLALLDDVDDPRCSECGGIVKVDVVFFGEMLPPGALERSFSLASDAGAVLAVGSTLSVFPAAGVPLEAVRAGRPLVIVNQGPTELDDLATVRVDGPAGAVLSTLADALS